MTQSNKSSSNQIWRNWEWDKMSLAPNCLSWLWPLLKPHFDCVWHLIQPSPYTVLPMLLDRQYYNSFQPESCHFRLRQDTKVPRCQGVDKEDFRGHPGSHKVNENSCEGEDEEELVEGLVLCVRRTVYNACVLLSRPLTAGWPVSALRPLLSQFPSKWRAANTEQQ